MPIQCSARIRPRDDAAFAEIDHAVMACAYASQNSLGFLVTAMTQEHHDYQQHLRRLLRCTSLQGIQWINLNHANIEWITLWNGKGMEAGE